MAQCTVYIDEAGDLGANRGTQWFVLTAVVVNKCDERAIREVLTSIKAKFNMNAIHWRTIGDFNKKSYIARQLSPLPFEYVNVLFDTKQYDKEKIPSYDIAYNFLCKYLLERVSWLLNDTGRTGDIVLSSRGTARDNELIEYISQKLLPYSQNKIADVFASVKSKAASQWDMLQLADICATTTFAEHETNWLGFTVPCHASVLRDKLYCVEGTVASYGIKYFQNGMIPPKGYFEERRMCAYSRSGK